MKEQILQHLGSHHPWAGHIHYFDTIGSTNTHAKEMAAAGAPHGTVLIAGQQTGGRGRLGRSFHSPAGTGIYLSVILRPDCTPAQLMHLTCAAGTAMCDAVEETARIRPGIKWINDLVIGRRKLGGILSELGLDAKTGRVSYAVVGIGINCSQSLENFPPELQTMATSLAMETGKPIDRSLLAAAMINALHTMDAVLFTEKETLLNRYRTDCITLGQKVQLHRSGSVSHGAALDIDAEGALLVLFEDGHVEAVNSGEVSVRGMYGYI